MADDQYRVPGHNKEGAFIVACLPCQQLLGSGQTMLDLDSVFRGEHRNHTLYTGAVTVEPMIAWLEQEINRLGMRG